MSANKIYTASQALEKSQKTCAYQERCQQEMRLKIRHWGIGEEETEQIIVELIINGFINEERFAHSFVRGKFNIKKWGKNKIIYALRQKQISEVCIKTALNEIDGDKYYKTLVKLIEKKAPKVKATKSYIKKQKVIKYFISRGYEYDIVLDALKESSAF